MRRICHCHPKAFCAELLATATPKHITNENFRNSHNTNPPCQRTTKCLALRTTNGRVARLKTRRRVPNLQWTRPEVLTPTSQARAKTISSHRRRNSTSATPTMKHQGTVASIRRVPRAPRTRASTLLRDGTPESRCRRRRRRLPPHQVQGLPGKLRTKNERTVLIKKVSFFLVPNCLDSNP